MKFNYLSLNLLSPFQVLLRVEEGLFGRGSTWWCWCFGGFGVIIKKERDFFQFDIMSFDVIWGNRSPKPKQERVIIANNTAQRRAAIL